MRSTGTIPVILTMCNITTSHPKKYRSALGARRFPTAHLRIQIETRNKRQMSSNKTHLHAAMHWANNVPLSNPLSVLQKHFMDVFQLRLVEKAESLCFSYSPYTAQTRYTKYWSIRSAYIAHPKHLPLKASRENVVRRPHNFSSSKRLDSQSGGSRSTAYSSKMLAGERHWGCVSYIYF